MLKQSLATLTVFAILTLITGTAYPLAVTLFARVAAPERARGDAIRKGDRVVAMTRIGQSFRDPGRFWSRPSATAPSPYNAGASAGSNLGPTNRELDRLIATRIQDLRAADPGDDRPVPVDLVTASASGLDPHLSPAAAEFQVRRVARVRGLSEESVRELIRRHTEPRLLGVIGEPGVLVVPLNLALDELRPR